MVLLNKDAEGVDWHRVTAFAERHGLAYRLTLGLRYLKERMDADIPDEVLRTLNDSHITILERLERISTLTVGEDPSVSLFGGIMRNLCEYQRIAKSRPDRKPAPGFLSYLCFRRELQRRRELGAWAARHAWRWGKRRLEQRNDPVTAAKP